MNKVIIAHTYGHLMDLKIRGWYKRSSDSPIFHLPNISGEDLAGFGALDLRQVVLDRYAEVMESEYGHQIWLPSPRVSFLKLSGDTSVYWIHTPRSNSHRLKWMPDVNTTTISFSDVGKMLVSTIAGEIMIKIMEEANKLNQM